MQKKPLAFRLRPKRFEDIVGQDHLVGDEGVLRKMVENKRFFSFILYGPPGTGKTSIAHVMGEAYGLNTFVFNASSDTKAALKDVVEHARHYGALLIVDEIHRMNKDVQDYLLPHVEAGHVTMIGITTNNPYHAVNPAIRSRTNIFKLKRLSQQTIKAYLENVVQTHEEDIAVALDDEVFDYIAQSSNGDIRSAINRLELLAGTATTETRIDLSRAEAVLQAPVLPSDKGEDDYYALLSALQKSIRGSDVDASLHYLGRLIASEDLDSILRRLSVIAYEDVGLANPSVFAKVEACANACLRVGFPEARIPLAAVVIDLALSPKSNSANKAIDAVLSDLNKGKTGAVPPHLINIDVFEARDDYRYPHDHPDHIVKQQYLPDDLLGTTYYTPARTGKYEDALAKRLEAVKARLR